MVSATRLKSAVEMRRGSGRSNHSKETRRAAECDNDDITLLPLISFSVNRKFMPKASAVGMQTWHQGIYSDEGKQNNRYRNDGVPSHEYALLLF